MSDINEMSGYARSPLTPEDIEKLKKNKRLIKGSVYYSFKLGGKDYTVDKELFDQIVEGESVRVEITPNTKCVLNVNKS
ncbi:MAG: hypothetical protein A2Y33_04500 [Spirochaetes bacterium GWF1_51_8]|nr:MAG: hypothetical protein A2Y33_04500 [Spirochaetes bacterium GWF1_51_8]